MSKQINNAPPLSYAFDSYIENGNLYIVTKEYSEIQGVNVACNNQIRLSRAKEILQTLSDNINLLEKMQNHITQTCKSCGTFVFNVERSVCMYGHAVV